MKGRVLKQLVLFLFLISFPVAVAAQEAKAKLQEEAARNQENAARNQETAARLAEDAITDNADAVARIEAAAQRAQEAANRAQEAANKAQAAANEVPNSGEAQSSATRAQEAANRAQESANRAQEIANRARRAKPLAARAVASPGPSPNPSASPSPSPSNSPAPTHPTNARVTGFPSGITDFNEFLNWRFDELVKTRLGPKNNTNQNESPSISTNSTSLVEKSSMSNLISMAVNPSGTSSNAKGTNPTSASVTVSAYAFKAFASGRDPLDPAFYGVNRNWRRFSFTYGYDYTKGKEGDPQEKGNIYGIKILPYDKRDVSDPANSKDVRTIADFLMGVGPSEARAVAKVERDLFNALSDKGRLPADVANETDARKRYNAFRAYLSGDNVLKDLTEALGADALIKLVDDIVAKNIDPDAKFTTAEQAAFDKIRSQPQIAFTFLTKQRKGTSPDEYMAGLTMDLGVMKRWNLTFNGMLNHTNNKLTKNSTGGTFATELQIPLNIVDHLGEHVPWTFSFAASGRWMTKEGPRYQGQAKLTIPFPRMPGVELPFSVSFANRSELLKGKESKVRGHIGFTFDLAKLLTAFKNQLALSPTH